MEKNREPFDFLCDLGTELMKVDVFLEKLQHLLYHSDKVGRVASAKLQSSRTEPPREQTANRENGDQATVEVMEADASLQDPPDQDDSVGEFSSELDLEIQSPLESAESLGEDLSTERSCGPERGELEEMVLRADVNQLTLRDLFRQVRELQENTDSLKTPEESPTAQGTDDDEVSLLDPSVPELETAWDQSVSEDLQEEQTWTHGDQLQEEQTWTRGDQLQEEQTWTHGDELREEQTWTRRDQLREEQTWTHGDQLQEEQTWTHGDQLREEQTWTHGDQLREEQTLTHGDQLREELEAVCLNADVNQKELQDLFRQVRELREKLGMGPLPGQTQDLISELPLDSEENRTLSDQSQSLEEELHEEWTGSPAQDERIGSPVQDKRPHRPEKEADLDIAEFLQRESTKLLPLFQEFETIAGETEKIQTKRRLLNQSFLEERKTFHRQLAQLHKDQQKQKELINHMASDARSLCVNLKTAPPGGGRSDIAEPIMEAVAVQNLIDFDLPSESSSLAVDSGKGEGADVFSLEPSSSSGVHPPLLPEAMAPTRSPLHQRRHEDGDSDATESADSENDMGPPCRAWELRRSSSSSAHSREDADAEGPEGRSFMKAYVEKVFHGKDEFDQEEKARFGELCSGETGKGREWFAKYVSAQRCHSKCVSEATFYRLVQSFAVVLFECYQMDDYSPAKNLMTMCFTYYYTGKCPPSPSELLERDAPPAGLDQYLNKANSWLTGKKDAAERLLKNSSRSDVRGFFGLDNKLRSKNEDGDSPVEVKSSCPVSGCEAPEEKRGEKVYLYTHLRQQPIWHTLRFWNAAFFDAVHCERKKRSPTTRGTQDEEKDEREKWCHMTQEERDDSSKIDENIAFGQLGTFTHNMLAFGLSKKLCNDFLKKQSVIGNLNEEQYKLLSDHIQKMASE